MTKVGKQQSSYSQARAMGASGRVRRKPFERWPVMAAGRRFFRHEKIYPFDEGAIQPRRDRTPAHRLDEFSAGYSLAGCSPALPTSASPAFSYAESSGPESQLFTWATTTMESKIFL